MLRALVQQIAARGEHALIFDADGSYTQRFYRPERGDIILNPWDRRSARWNPLGDVRDLADARRIAAVLIPKPQGLTEGAIWYEQARAVLAQLMLHLVRRGAGLDDFAAMLARARPHDTHRRAGACLGGEISRRRAARPRLRHR